MNYWLLLIPFIAAFVGWSITRIAIKLLFHPREPKKVLGFTFQGIFPKRQQQFAEKLGRLVSAEFSSFDQIEEKISDPQNVKNIMPLVEEHVDDFLRNKMKEQMPVLGMFIGDKTINTLKTVFLKEIENLFPLVMKQFASNLKNDFDLEQLVITKVSGFSPAKVEGIFYQALSKELRFVGIIGAITGFLTGVVQIAVTLLIS